MANFCSTASPIKRPTRYARVRGGGSENGDHDLTVGGDQHARDMTRPENAALRGSTALAVWPAGVDTRCQAEKDLLNVLRMP